MGCCGQKRAVLRNTPPTITPVVTPPAPTKPPLRHPGQLPPGGAAPFLVAVRYLESSPILVRGVASGRQYEFSGAQPVQAVDASDAEALLRTRFFRRT